MSAKNTYRVILAAVLIMGLLFLGTTVSLAQPKAKIKLDPLEIPKHVKKPKPEVERGILAAAEELAEKNLSAELAKGIAARGKTKVLKETPKGYEAETIVINQLKETYTAEMSRIEFSYEDGKAKVKKIDKTYQPKARKAPPQVGRDAKLEGDKKKLAVERKAVKAPADPEKFNVEPVIKEAEEAERREGHHSWWLARGLAATPCTMFPSAVSATRSIHAYFYYTLGSSARREGSACTEREIKDFLKNDYRLLAFNFIGHGVTASRNGAPCYGLVMWGGQTIWYYEFGALSPYRGIYWSVAFTNSCNSFKNPLNAYIWSRRPKTFIGGNILLPVGRSEYSDRNFWYYTLFPRWEMSRALAQAQRDKGFPVGTFGLKGWSGRFF